jgi:glucose/mannose-6-phosphate isomerase
MLDDSNVIGQRDPEDALGVAAAQAAQARFSVHVANPENDNRQITRVVVVGMGGSALAAMLAKAWLKSELNIPFEVVRTYELPEYVDYNTLVIASSYSGNTEEALAGLKNAQNKFAQVAIIAAGGELKKIASAQSISWVELPASLPQRMTTIFNLRALTALFAHFGVASYDRFAEIADQADWLATEVQAWTSNVTTDKNYAKQLALMAVGKTPVFYAGSLMAPVAYKWKISWNENAKNVAFWNEYPEFNHNEFIGWTSHPIEKPFAVFDLISNLENPRIIKRFEISDRLLSGKRPKATVVTMKGSSAIAQLLWGSILADFVSIYVAILNGVDPTPVPLIEKLKKELADQ